MDQNNSKFIIVEPTDGSSGATASRFTEDQLETLDKAINLTCAQFHLQKVDYAAGTIHISNTYNRNTPDQWTQDDFIVVNIGACSVACAFHSAYEAVYRHI